MDRGKTWYETNVDYQLIPVNVRYVVMGGILD